MVVPQFRLTTTRCVLRPVAPADAASLHALWTSPGVRRFLWDDEVIPLARTMEAIEQSERLFAERSFGLWSAWLAEPNHALAGFAGLWPFRDPPEWELLYGVAEPLWGQGYATEIGRAVTDYCLGPLAMPIVRASTDVANVASVRVMERLGFSFARRAKVDGLETVFYERSPHARGRI